MHRLHNQHGHPLLPLDSRLGHPSSVAAPGERRPRTTRGRICSTSIRRPRRPRRCPPSPLFAGTPLITQGTRYPVPEHVQAQRWCRESGYLERGQLGLAEQMRLGFFRTTFNYISHFLLCLVLRLVTSPDSSIEILPFFLFCPRL